MYLTREHVKVLQQVRQGRFEDIQKDAVVRRRILELQIQGLLDQNKITEAGEKILEAFPDIEGLEDPLVNSEIVKICELFVATGKILPRWKALLNARKIDERAARLILDAYRFATPAILITPEISTLLLSIPPGPGMLGELNEKVRELGFGKNILNAFEAMRWLKISPETRGRTYVLTPRAREIRRILTRIPVAPYVLITKFVAELLASKKESPETTVMELVAGRELTAAGKALLEAYRISEVLSKITPIYITLDEVKVLKAIDDLHKLHEKNPQILPTYDRIEKKSGVKTIGEVLAVLESKGWIKRVEVKGKDTYALTEPGRKVLALGIYRDIGTNAVKAITFALAGDVPIPEWVQEARMAGLVSGDITKRGWIVYELAKEMHRIPILVGYDAVVLAKVPRKGIDYAALVSEVATFIRTERPDIRMPKVSPERRARIAIAEAEARGYVTVLQNGVVVLTRAGELMKQVIEYGKTRELMNTVYPITPTTYHLVRVLYEERKRLWAIWTEEEEKKLEEAIKLAYNEIKRYTSITIDEIKKQLTILRRIGLLGKMGVTEAGRLLLEVGKIL